MCHKRHHAVLHINKTPAQPHINNINNKANNSKPSHTTLLHSENKQNNLKVVGLQECMPDPSTSFNSSIKPHCAYSQDNGMIFYPQQLFI